MLTYPVLRASFAPESDHGANAGLKVVRDLLDPIKKQYPGLSYSDLWTLAGVVAVQEMQGPKIGWRSGREDRTAEHCTPDGRLPDGDKGSDHLRHIFYKVGSPHQLGSSSLNSPLMSPAFVSTDGLQRPCYCSAFRCARTGAMPHGPIRLRRAMDLLSHHVHQRLLQAPV